MLPSLILSNPFRQRRSVVLPLPDAPMIPSTVCGGTSNETPRRIRVPLADLMRLVTRIILISLPLPLGEGRREGLPSGNPEKEFFFVLRSLNPHPTPLPEGEGTQC